MIRAIMEIGNWVMKKESESDPIGNFIQNPNERGNIQKVLTISLKNQQGKYVYEGVGVEQFTETRVFQYLYRRGSARGADITPTSKFAGDMNKTFNNKIIKSIHNIEKNAGLIGLEDEEKEIIKNISAVLSDKKDTITESLISRSDEIPNNQGIILTLVLENNGNKYYIGDINLFKKVLKQQVKEKYYKQYGKKSVGNRQCCSVCRQKKAEVFGFVNTYNFYTVDKPGFVTGGFRQKDAWKNYPVCYECAVHLELGRKYLYENLSFSFYGFKYLLIPKFLNHEMMEEAMEILEDAYEQKASEMLDTSFTQKYTNRLTDAESELFGLIKDYNDYLSFDLLFYMEKQAAFNIILHVEDILPSRFKKLFQIKARLDEIDIFKSHIRKDDGRRLVIFNFGLLRDFLPFISKTRTYDKHFIELTEKIFALKPIEYRFIVQAIVSRIRSTFVKGQSTIIYCLRGYLLLNFLAELGILKKGGMRMNIQPIEDIQEDFHSGDKSIPEKIERFFEAHTGFFDSASKKAVFLAGVLVQKLLNIQWRDKNGATPFRSKLKGLRLNEALVKSISKDAQEKLEQYKKNYYKELESIISQYMVVSGSGWRLTNDEISFYFTTGMNMAGLFKTEKEEEENDGDRK